MDFDTIQAEHGAQIEIISSLEIVSPFSIGNCSGCVLPIRTAGSTTSIIEARKRQVPSSVRPYIVLADIYTFKIELSISRLKQFLLL
jgi:hypothetical protein